MNAAVKQGEGRPKKGYYTKDGKRCPGVTTIVSRFKDAGGLIHWAWQQGYDGIDYRQKRDEAADAGHLAHDFIECDIHGRELPDTSKNDPELVKLALKALEAFRDWKSQVKLEIIETETPLVSERYRFGGTFDALARVNGKIVLLDWKTSNAVYSDYIAQVGAYGELLMERGTIVDGAQLLRFGKEYADFHHHSYPREVLDKGWRFFQLAREMYDIDAVLKKVAA